MHLQVNSCFDRVNVERTRVHVIQLDVIIPILDTFLIGSNTPLLYLVLPVLIVGTAVRSTSAAAKQGAEKACIQGCLVLFILLLIKGFEKTK